MHTGPGLLRSYGRMRGRRLRARKRGLMGSLLPSLTVALPESGLLDLASLFPGAPPVWLEVGFGGGEHLAAQAEANPGVGFIGCEPFEAGVASLLAEVSGRRLSNVRIFAQDARLLIERLPAASVERVFVLFPDPWPKARHHKRRLVATPLLQALARIMKPAAELRLATDDAPYAAWMLEHLLASADFTWTARQCSDWQTPPPGWVQTRYQQKALEQGRHPFWILALRR